MSGVEILKTAASIVSSLMIIGGFVVAIFKPVRARITNWIIGTSGAPTCNAEIDKLVNTVANMQKSLDEHIKQSDAERKETLGELTKVNKKLDDNLETQRNSCRNLITDMYYKYGKYGEIPRYKHELLIKTYTNYKSMGGNSFIDELYEEMKDIKIVD